VTPGGRRPGTAGGLLARNTVLNLAGQLLPLLVAAGAIPFLVRGLGADAFGLLALVWMVVTFFGELGFGRATTKFAAEAAEQGDGDRLVGVVWGSLLVQAGLGLLAGGLLALAAPFASADFLQMPAELEAPARGTILLTALAVPILMVSSSLRGILEAEQRFDLVNAVRVPSGMASFLLPLAGMFLGMGLVGIVALLLAGRVLTVLAFAVLSLRVVPELRSRPRVRELGTLFRFGAWTAVSSVVSPLLVYLDRVVLAAVISVAAVAYYAAPFEVVIRLLLIPGSLAATLFPAFSALRAGGDRERTALLASRSVKYILLALGPLGILLVGSGWDLLHLWLGPEYAREGALALRILAVGVVINSVAWVPFTLLQGIGRPDLTGWFHLLELPVHAVLVVLLVGAWGVPGAALAWSLRVALDAALLFWAAGRVAGVGPREFAAEGVFKMGGLVVVGGALGALVGTMGPHPWVRVGLTLAILGVVTGVAWRHLLGDEDRTRLRGLVRRARSA
jgi:O-antigen/teichoic acid export membrane protein